MKFFFFQNTTKKSNDETGKHELVKIEEHEHDITQGGEFLDDAIRMKEQPLMFAEESIAPGSAQNLW